MIITTNDQIPGKEIVEVLGIVEGNTIRARNIGRDGEDVFGLRI
jgi:uncharacterized protein YbjQ (UPF0145 family)